MRDRQSDLPATAGVPASMFEGMFSDAMPELARLREWGALAVELLRAGRADLLTNPEIDDVPFDLPPPAEDEPADHGPRCLAEHETTDAETPLFDLIESVRGLQQRLIWLGFHRGSATGLLDDDTHKAVRAFQEEARLPDSGLPDQATRTALVRRTLW